MVQRGSLLQTVLVIVACFFPATVESQTVSVHAPNVGTQRGDIQAIIYCNITDLPADTYIEWIYYPTWQPTGFTIFTSLTNITYDSTNFAVSRPKPQNDTYFYNLVMNTIEPEFATRYLCNVAPVLDKGKFVDVTVLEPVECYTSSVEYQVGDEVNISCSVNFYGSIYTTVSPRLTWYRNEQPISGGVYIDESDIRKTLLLTRKATSADDGQEFVCGVDYVDSNPVYTDSCSAVVNVNYETVNVYPPIVAAQTGGQNVTLSCDVTSPPPSSFIEWVYYPTWQQTGFTIFTTYTNLTTDPTNFTVPPLTAVDYTQILNLVINTMKPELATEYLCDLSPTPGMGKSIQVIALDQVECYTSSVEYALDEVANISCSVNYFQSVHTNTSPRLTWYRDGQPISGGVYMDESDTRKTLVLTRNVTSANDGQEFTCIVDFVDSNPVYTDSCSTVVHVPRKRHDE